MIYLRESPLFNQKFFIDEYFSFSKILYLSYSEVYKDTGVSSLNVYNTTCV